MSLVIHLLRFEMIAATAPSVKRKTAPENLGRIGD
jgi:hypothetical protein